MELQIEFWTSDVSIRNGNKKIGAKRHNITFFFFALLCFALRQTIVLASNNGFSDRNIFQNGVDGRPMSKKDDAYLTKS